ncbi:MAG: hypothetical protein GY827_02395 [Cytophagales bacterium]|nr:hypothetical protein [Cytophagales bacterium]
MKENKYREIAVILTPFQLMQLELLHKQGEVDLSKAICFLSPIISSNEVQRVLGADVLCYEIPWVDIRFTTIIKNPFLEVPKHRKLIANFKEFAQKTLSDNNVQELTLWLGTEKDIFTQSLMNISLQDFIIKDVCAIDEGLGFYGTSSMKDYFMKLLYVLITPLIFGQKIYYTSVLGSHSMFTKVYARFLDYLPYKRSSVEYIELSPIVESGKNVENNKNVLFFTSPLAEDGHCSESEEANRLDTIFKLFSEKGYTLYLKPHPRENVTKYNGLIDNYSVEYLSKEYSAEKLDYFSFGSVVHFGSSVILDLYQKKYPLERMITIDMEYNYHQLTQSMFEKGQYIRLFSNELEKEIREVLL